MTEAEANPAVLFDIDGTLVDSNYLHVYAWQQTFAEMDLDVEGWRIHRSIGMDGSELITTLCPGISDDNASRAKDLHTHYYQPLTDLLRPLPGARRLLDAVSATGLQVILATSAPDDELSILRKVLQRDDIVSAMTSSDDVETAKPQPDIVEVALKRANVTADRAVFLGDTVWDVRAAKRAGVQAIAVLSGGVSRHELEIEGAVQVFENANELADHVDDTSIGKLARTI